MSAVLRVRDETTSGKITLEFKLHFLSERITVLDLIKRRISEEVNNYNKEVPDLFNGLVQPSLSEQVVNGYKVKKRLPIDVEQQYQKALEAFGTSSLLVLVDNHQAESLDEEIHIMPHTLVTFLKLVPLVGG